MEDTFTNTDLVRSLLTQSSHATPLLSTSREIRQGDRCSSMFQKWASTSCPVDVRGNHESECLAAVGGLESPFCTGTFDVTTLDYDGLPTVHTGVSPSSFAHRVNEVLSVHEQYTRLNTVVSITIAGTDESLLRIKVCSSSEVGMANSTVTLTQGGWRSTGMACRLTRSASSDLIQSILTSIGSITVPCPAASNIKGPITVGRRIQVKISRLDETTGQDWTLLTAIRQ